MKKHNLLTTIAKVFTIVLLLSGAHAGLLAQVSINPLPGGVFGQPIVACSNGTYYNYDFAATSGAIYARPEDEDAFYFKVFDAPAGYAITSFANKKDSTGNYRVVTLTDDNGKPFTCYNKINAPLPDVTISGPSALPQQGGFVMAGAVLYSYSNFYYSSILYISLDNGQTWVADTAGLNLNSGINEISAMALDNNQNPYLTCARGLFKQGPNGGAWTLVNNNISGDSTVRVQSMFIDQRNRIIAGTDSFFYNFAINSYVTYLFISNDNGATFYADSINAYVPELGIVGDNSGNIYVWSNNAIYREAATNVNNWVLLDSALLLNAATNPTCFSAGNSLTLGNAHGIFTSTNMGNSFNLTNGGIPAKNIYSIITQPNGRQLCTTDYGVFYKDASDLLWNFAFDPTGSGTTGQNLYNDRAGNIYLVAAIPVPGCVIPAPVPPYKSTDNGLTWTIDSFNFDVVGGSGFYLDETGARHFYNTFSTFSQLPAWSSAQASSIINADTAGLPTPDWGGGIKTMCGDQHGYLYACYNQFNGSQNIIFRRPVNGGAWLPDTNGLGPINGYIIKMASNPSLGIIVSSGTQLFHRGVNGWDTISQAAGITAVNAISIDDNGVIFLASNAAPLNQATYYTNDGGLNWQSTLTGINVQALRSIGKTTYALTTGKWGYAITMLDSTTGEHVISLSRGIQVFPNPSPTGLWTVLTNDEWTGSQAELVDMTGRIVFHGNINSTNAKINTPGLAPGNYILNLHNAEKSTSTVLIK